MCIFFLLKLLLVWKYPLCSFVITLFSFSFEITFVLSQNPVTDSGTVSYIIQFSYEILESIFSEIRIHHQTVSPFLAYVCYFVHMIIFSHFKIFSILLCTNTICHVFHLKNDFERIDCLFRVCVWKRDIFWVLPILVVLPCFLWIFMNMFFVIGVVLL